MSSEMAAACTRRRGIVGRLFITALLLTGSILCSGAQARDSVRAVTPKAPPSSTGGSSITPPRSVLAATLTVNTTSDTDDGVCDATHCSLREAINLSNAGDTINFSALFNAPQTIKLAGPLAHISKNLTITGPGPDLLEVRRDSGGDYEIFYVAPGATVGLAGLTIANGSSGFAGGIVLFSANLTLSNAVVTRNFNGGGIYSQESTLNIVNSVISFNHGGIVLSSNVATTISGSLITGNDSPYAGGISNLHGPLTITDSTISNNTAYTHQYAAGALYTESANSPSSVTLTNTTVSGNSAVISGNLGASAIVNRSYGSGTSTLTMTNCTIADSGGSALAALVTVVDGAGFSAKTHLKNTILDNVALPNLAAFGTGALIISDGNNLANDSGSPYLRVTPPADVINTDAKLAPLAWFGGPTPVHLLLPGSPAIDAGNDVGAPVADQRGAPRPVGAHVDIGAVELNSRLVNSSADPGDGVCDGSCTLRDAMLAANAASATTMTDIEFDPALFGSAQTIKLGAALPAITSKMNMVGTGPDLLEVRRDSGGNYTVFDAEGGASVSIAGMTIANGAGTSAGGVSNVASTMHLAHVAVTGNTSSNSFSGGGVGNFGHGTLAITDSVVSLNQSGAFGGGGIANQQSALTVTNTLVTRNSAQGGGGGMFDASGRIVVDSSTISNNSVPSSGVSAGGLYIDDYNASADARLVNTTLSGNSAAFSTSGSAILNNGASISTSNLHLEFCTVAANTGSAAAAVLTRAAASTTARSEFSNSIFSNGASANLGTIAASATVVSTGHNLASDGGSGLLTGSGDLINTDPQLARLGNYGGPTPTHALLAGSPAIDAGNDGDSPNADQRGLLRFAGAHVDVGAVELNPLLVNSSADPGDGTCDATCTLRDAVLAMNAAAGRLVDIEFDASAFASPQTINLGSALPDITGSVDIIGTGANRLTVRRNSADAYSVFTIDAGVKASLSGLTVSNGQTASNGFGGGINNAGTLTLARMAIDANTASFGSGGGIFNNAGALTVDDSTISNNAANDGAGLYNSPGFVHLTNTTFSGNDASSHFTGGITNISFGSGPAIVSLLNSTIANNSGGTEGGIYTSYDAVTRMKNTIVAGNSLPNITGGGASSIASLGNNLANDNGAGFLTASGDLINTPALLAPLAYYGGPTRTQDPLAGSPAAFAGNPAGAPLDDQRGYTRLATSVDIGAVESDVLFRDGFDLL